MRPGANRRRTGTDLGGVSLNPELDRKDKESADAIFIQNVDAELKDRVEWLWYAVLYCGEPLTEARCTQPRWRDFIIKSKIVPTLTDLMAQRFKTTPTVNADAKLKQFAAEVQSEAMSSFDSQLRGAEFLSSIQGFCRAVVRLALVWQVCRRKAMNEPLGAGPDEDLKERLAATRRFFREIGNAFIDAVRAQNNIDGSGPDDLYLLDPEVDRTLYIFDGVFDRLFHRYRTSDTHGNRDLTLEQNVLLDDFVELDEMRDLCKDYGIFPKYVSFVEISIACQCACFGKVVVNPTKQAQARKSEIKNDEKAAQRFRDQQGQQVVADISATSAATITSTALNLEALPQHNTSGVNNPLFIAALPPEYLTDEPLLDKARFMSCMVRLAQAVFNRPEFNKQLPSISSRLDELLRSMRPAYERMFAHSMDVDCDFAERGIPALACATAQSAIAPTEVPMEGGAQVTISGSNFCEKRGVYVRFTDQTGQSTVMRSVAVYKRSIVVATPPMQPLDVAVDVAYVRGAYQLRVARSSRVFVECSNNRLDYSNTDPAQYTTFRQDAPVRTLDVEVADKLLRTFATMCAVGQSYGSSKFMVRSNWGRLKALYELSEVLRHGTKAVSRTDDDATAVANARDLFFLEYQEKHDTMNEPALDFRGYLRALGRCFVEDLTVDGLWFDEFARVAEIQYNPENVNAGRAEDDSGTISTFATAQRHLIEAEWRPWVDVDIFCGPVYCGTASSRPGFITSRVPNVAALSPSRFSDGLSLPQIANSAGSPSRSGGGGGVAAAIEARAKNLSSAAGGGSRGAAMLRGAGVGGTNGLSAGGGYATGPHPVSTLSDRLNSDLYHQHLRSSPAFTAPAKSAWSTLPSRNGSGGGSGVGGMDSSGTTTDSKDTSGSSFLGGGIAAPFTYAHGDDVLTERPLIQFARESHSCILFLQRLVTAGFDIAARNPRGHAMRPAGRCWTLFDSTGTRRLGALWDHSGWFSTPLRQPAEHALKHQCMSITMYAGEDVVARVVDSGVAFRKLIVTDHRHHNHHNHHHEGHNGTAGNATSNEGGRRRSSGGDGAGGSAAAITTAYISSDDAVMLHAVAAFKRCRDATHLKEVLTGSLGVRFETHLYTLPFY
jgi:hypothetical protein